MAKQRITLFTQDGTWHAQFKNDAHVIKLFGTDTIPTPFGSNLNAAEVAADIRRRNPDADVQVEHDCEANAVGDGYPGTSFQCQVCGHVVA